VPIRVKASYFVAFRRKVLEKNVIGFGAELGFTADFPTSILPKETVLVGSGDVIEGVRVSGIWGLTGGEGEDRRSFDCALARFG
jgi:hypothetical protein